MLGKELICIVRLSPFVHERLARGLDCIPNLLVVGGVVVGLDVWDTRVLAIAITSVRSETSDLLASTVGWIPDQWKELKLLAFNVL